MCESVRASVSAASSAEVNAERCDVGEMDQVRGLAKTLRDAMVSGVMHLAGVLDDSTFLKLIQKWAKEGKGYNIMVMSDHRCPPHEGVADGTSFDGILILEPWP